MFADDLPDDLFKVNRVEAAITALGQATQKLHGHGSVFAPTTATDAERVLGELQPDFHFQPEEQIKQLSKFH